MPEKRKKLFEQLNTYSAERRSLWQIVTSLSLVVIVIVFWSLKLTGIGIAGEAFCGKDEHYHSDECLTAELICTLEEAQAHQHCENCILKVLICGQEETADHTHTDECWDPGKGFGCGLSEADGHTHTAECLTEETELGCSINATEGHTHTDECYKQLDACPLEEHIHDETCYSNIHADLETSNDWEMTLADIVYGTTISENVVLVARSQLGYTESTLNFQVDANGVRRGITRYGQWYGNPYGDWSAMFVAFCLEYAGGTDLPVNSGPEAMRLEWEIAGLYGNAADFDPDAGQLLFLDKNENGSADSIAVITGLEENKIQVIEGDLENTVAKAEYDLGSPVILGYGRVPQVPQIEVVPNEGATLIGQTGETSTELLIDGAQVLVYLTDEAGSYAMDGNGELIDITIAPDGSIYTESEQPEQLLWSVTEEDGSAVLRNLATGMYLPPSPAMGIRAYAANDSGSDNNYQYARAVNHFIWLDGTNGGIMAYNGSLNTRYTLTDGATFKLPETWQSPAKYNYVLSGWYDIVNNKYYAPGEEITIGHSSGDDIKGNAVFYADWKAASYDVGQFNSQVTDTVSTNSFVTTRMFDYSVLMNILSERANVTFNNNGSSYTDTWNLLTNGNNPYNGDPVTNFILRDWDAGGQDISYPNGHNDRNNPTDAGTVYRNLYTEQIRDIFFDPSLELPGKQYLGTGDHLFQLCLDPAHEHYGYYYYNSERNAASYNQSDQRFYVYDYLECTRTSYNSGNEGKYSDFLPLNSPYANTNGKHVNTYTYQGTEGEYVGTTHYMYDCRYNDSNNSTNNVGTNFWFGMSVEVEFYLPNNAGATVNGGEYGNQDIYGKDMHFRFTGDDDVWIFVDDTMVLDLGGLHGMETGDINFSTGTVTINGVVDNQLSNNLKTIKAGEHKLTLYYMERGSSMSNCAIYFNLAPRFAFSIQKEDVLTRDVLNGAQFSVYTDPECTQPAQLWTSKASHDQGDPSTNVFTVVDGMANMWGMGAGNIYYIRETKAPDDPEYGFPNGLIRLTFDSQGTASYQVDILDEGGGVSPGFTVHGFRIDPETQQAYIVATNAPEWVEEVTSVQVKKHWNDQLNHSGQSVTVYLTVTDPDGTVRRLQEVVLSDANDWHAKWENLPKYLEDGVTPVNYGVEEAYTSGYYTTVEKETDGEFAIVKTSWQNAGTFQNGKVYLLKNASGQCLSTLRSAEDVGYMWVTQDTAVKSNLALWTASVRNNTVRLTNQAGQTITFWYGGGSPTDFFALNQHVEDNNRKQYLTFEKSGSAFRLKYDRYYLASTLNGSSKFENTTDRNRALLITPVEEVTRTENIPIENQGFLVTNTPLEKETSLTVRKHWDYGNLPAGTAHEKAQVTVKLLAGGKDTGRTVTLSLRNGWKDTFRGLPYTDEDGNVFVYTVEEVWNNIDWIPEYGETVTNPGDPPTYSTEITNKYRFGFGEILPSTGTAARLMYILCGGTIMLLSLVFGFGARRKRERRMK